MGKACIILAAMMLALFIFPKNQANGASIENPLQQKSRFELESRDVDAGAEVGGMEYDYAFLNQPEPDFGGSPRRSSKTMKRHGRLMKRLRRYAKADQSIPSNKIPAGCCSCGAHYCCEGMCHGK